MIAKRREEEGKRVSFIRVFFVLKSSVVSYLVSVSFTPLSRRSDEATGLMDLYFSFLLLL